MVTRRVSEDFQGVLANVSAYKYTQLQKLSCPSAEACTVWLGLWAVYNFGMTANGAPIDDQTVNLLENLSREMQGEVDWSSLGRTLYGTDASAYQETPLAVAFPETEEDLGLLIRFANQHRIGLIPRTAGTSLAGQVVGSGIVVDVSRHWNRILDINPDERWVRVQPGVIRDELNMALVEHGLLFGPETSTANRAMVGGMLGNNSCGSNSVVYGSCLLYTSPSPRDKRQSRMPSSA